MKGVNCHFHLPEDLAIGILLRLPVKSLLRFKSVCKAWHAIISNPSFIRKHFHREGNSISLLAYWSGVRYHEPFHINGPFYDYFNEFTMFHGEFLERCEDADHIELPGHISRMRGPCNGIFCLLHSEGKLALWNTAMRRLHEVPNCPLQLKFRVFDFGIDPLTGDIKIVVIYPNDMTREFAIYNLSNNSWSLRNQNLVPAAGYSVVTGSNYFGPTFSGGFCYWMKCNEEASHFVILAFDLHNELFQELEMPEINLLESPRVERQLVLTNPVNRESRVKRQLYWYNDSLALLTYQSFAGETHVDIWSMKEHGCWTKVWNFSLPFLNVISIGVWMNKKIYAVTSDWELVICHTRTGKSKNLEFRRVEYACNNVLFAFPYKESLFSPSRF